MYFRGAFFGAMKEQLNSINMHGINIVTIDEHTPDKYVDKDVYCSLWAAKRESSVC